MSNDNAAPSLSSATYERVHMANVDALADLPDCAALITLADRADVAKLTVLAAVMDLDEVLAQLPLALVLKTVTATRDLLEASTEPTASKRSCAHLSRASHSLLATI